MPCKKTRLFPILPYKMGILGYGFWALKVLPPLWLPCSKKVWDWRLPKRYFLSMCLKGLQSCRLSNFFHSSKITFFFLYIIVIWKQRHLWTLLIFWSTKTLTACNFTAPWDTWTSSTFLETSNLILFGAKWSWGWQDFFSSKTLVRNTRFIR